MEIRTARGSARASTWGGDGTGRGPCQGSARTASGCVVWVMEVDGGGVRLRLLSMLLLLLLLLLQLLNLLLLGEGGGKELVGREQQLHARGSGRRLQNEHTLAGA